MGESVGVCFSELGLLLALKVYLLKGRDLMNAITDVLAVTFAKVPCLRVKVDKSVGAGSSDLGL